MFQVLLENLLVEDYDKPHYHVTRTNYGPKVRFEPRYPYDGVEPNVDAPYPEIPDAHITEEKWILTPTVFKKVRTFNIEEMFGLDIVDTIMELEPGSELGANLERQ